MSCWPALAGTAAAASGAYSMVLCNSTPPWSHPRVSAMQSEACVMVARWGQMSHALLAAKETALERERRAFGRTPCWRACWLPVPYLQQPDRAPNCSRSCVSPFAPMRSSLHPSFPLSSLLSPLQSLGRKRALRAAALHATAAARCSRSSTRGGTRPATWLSMRHPAAAARTPPGPSCARLVEVVVVAVFVCVCCRCRWLWCYWPVVLSVSCGAWLSAATIITHTHTHTRMLLGAGGCRVQVQAKDQAASALDVSRRGNWLVAGFSEGVMRVRA